MKYFFFIALLMIGCNNPKSEHKTEKTRSKKVEYPVYHDSIINSPIHQHLESLICDLDGDNLNDSVRIVQSVKNRKFGLKISFGNKNVSFIGMGKDVLGQGFDDFDWIGIFKKVDKGEVVWNNLDENDEIITDTTKIKEEDKIKLKNDAIFLHQAEACGGGIIYFETGKFHWVRQE